MAGLLERLRKGEVLISDGAMGTFLQALGLKPGECPESWNETHRDAMIDIAQRYLNAGSTMIETNSFGGTRYKLECFGLGGKVRVLNRLATQIAKEAAGPDRLVAASVGPTGKFVEPYGDETEEQMYEAFREQITALAEGGADAICIETMSDLIEARLAVQAAKNSTDLPVICTFTFDKQPSGEYRTMMGVLPGQVAEEMPAAGADIIGSNCGNGVENMVEIAKAFRKSTDAFTMFQANAGMPVLEGKKTVFKETPEQMAARVKDFLRFKVSIIGGCCGTTPDHIKAIAKAAKTGWPGEGKSPA